MQDLKETTSYRASLRGRIIDCALLEFAKNGIRAVKMDDIASALVISKRTLYEIFKDKETLLFESIKEYEARKKLTLKAYSEKGHHVMDIILEAYRMKIEEVNSVNPAFYIDLMKYPKLEECMRENNAHSRDDFMAFMNRGVEEGFLRADANYEMIPYMFDAIVQYVIANNMVQKYTVEELFSNYFLIALRGLCTEKGLRLIDEVMSKIKTQ
jgi:AcrR family transcriptional regulator